MDGKGNKVTITSVSWHSKIGRRLGIFGIMTCAVSLVFCLFPDLLMARNDEAGPFVFLACDQPNQKFTVYVTNEGKPESTIVFMWEPNSEYSSQQFEEVTLWAMVQDKNSYSWECEGDIEATNVDWKNGLIAPTQLNEGRGKATLFRYAVHRNGKVSAIRIKSDEADYLAEGGGTLRQRIPWIAPWMSEDTSYVNEDIEYVVTDDPLIIHKTIDGKPLYQPLNDNVVSVLDLSYFDSTLELESVQPTPTPLGSYLMWTEPMLCCPEIRYTRVNSSARDSLQSNVALLVFGFGLSVIYESIRL